MKSFKLVAVVDTEINQFLLKLIKNKDSTSGDLDIT